MRSVTAIEANSPCLQQVKNLWKQFSDTLGFLPWGAFDEYADAGQLGVTFDEAGCVAGYLLYRSVGADVVIIQFCVRSDLRGQGHGHALMDWLNRQCRNKRLIRLSCRTDFQANKTWPHYGFRPSHRRPGKAGTLQVWVYDLGRPDLFSSDAESNPDILSAAVDMNVFLDLTCERNEESRGLRADWLAPIVQFCYTSEIEVEFNRNEQHEEFKKLLRKDSKCWRYIPSPPGEYRRMEELLQPIFPRPSNERDRSDFRHAVHAAAAGANVLLTRDEALLDHSDEVFKACGLTIIRPSEFISSLDRIEREQAYQPRYVAGSRVVSQSRLVNVQATDARSLLNPSERFSDFRDRFNQYLSRPERFSCFRLADSQDALLGMYVLDAEKSERKIPLLRVCRGTTGRTILRALLCTIVRETAAVGCERLTITDLSMDSTAFREIGFISTSSGWLKLILNGIRDPLELVAELRSTQDCDVTFLVQRVEAASNCTEAAAEAEHFLWPVKLKSSPLLNFIVPIQACFAEHLFDWRLTSESLFGVDPLLALNIESAYYRAARPPRMTAPARVLWYVSKSDRHEECMSIRACSSIVEVVTGTPRELYKMFRRFGVYEWRDVLKTARAIDKKLMAFRFTGTELFKPLRRDVLQAVLNKYAVKTANFIAPVQIPTGAFEELYAACLHPPSVR